MKTLLLALLCLAAPAFAGAAPCGGDCDGDGAVGINELVRAVSIALGSTPANQCASADANGDGTVTIAELIGAVNAALGGGGQATPTSGPTPTRTPGVIAPCENGSFDFTHSNVSGDRNAITTPHSVTLVSAAQTRDPNSGRYVLGIVGLPCTDNMISLERSIQLQLIATATGFVPGTYPITPPFGSLVYGELQTPNVFLRAWDTAGGTLTIEEVAGSRLRFRITAPMKPQPLLDFGATTEGTFTLEISGTVEQFTSS
jgi:hypothetical protein